MSAKKPFKSINASKPPVGIRRRKNLLRFPRWEYWTTVIHFGIALMKVEIVIGLCTLFH